MLIISQLPTSDAPDWVREALKGVEVCAIYRMRGGMTGLVTERNFGVQSCFVVVLSKLIEKLRDAGKGQAAKWFSELPSSIENNIAFLEKECTVV